MQQASDFDPVAYVTVLSTDNYLDGVLVLNDSLRRCRSQYRLYVLVGGGVTAPVYETLAAARIPTIHSRPLAIPEEIIRVNLSSDYHRHWAGVFEKLVVFSLCQFRKIVFVDSDMLVMKNIDSLFERPHMSAVSADVVPGKGESTDFNAGLMVLEPESELTDRLVEVVPEVFEQEKQWRMAAGRPPSMGMQSVVNHFWREWNKRNELHLDRKYNVLTTHLDYYRRELDYKWRGPDGIHVLHFIGEVKPWMRTGRDLASTVVRLVRARRIWELAALTAYKAALARARRHLKSARAVTVTHAT